MHYQLSSTSISYYTYNAICHSQIIEIKIDIDICVDLSDCNVDIFSKNLFDLDLDQSHSFLTKFKWSFFHFLVNIVQIARDGFSYNLLNVKLILRKIVPFRHRQLQKSQLLSSKFFNTSISFAKNIKFTRINQ